ncbi:hypothetical protein COV18_02030 [Candidatus Woesearchaeota archaeon CG10_big_fil_rev_8_21_14_0_10_37_12]|nr:MAG: hypothetical protein COV18_02030 [Candidatus Woesearchaeota archaeon CG10_big_fil_rev_8_21_14_0_10_37_12]
MNIILLGSTGYLGSQIKTYLEKTHNVICPKSDVTDKQQIHQILQNYDKKYIVINATGKTGYPNVDGCEHDKKNTASVNITGAINVAEVTSKLGMYLIQLGSGCIFQGTNNGKGYSEEDLPNFFGSFYSQTKAVAEQVLKEYEHLCILRIRMPIQATPNQRNVLTKILNYQKIISLPNSITVVEDFLPFIEKICEQKIKGIINAVNPGIYQHKDILDLYAQQDPTKIFTYISEEEFDKLVEAKRSNCILSTKKTEQLGIAMPPIQERLPWLVQEYIKQNTQQK